MSEEGSSFPVCHTAVNPTLLLTLLGITMWGAGTEFTSTMLSDVQFCLHLNPLPFLGEKFSPRHTKQACGCLPTQLEESRN
jgi:hypothetical protein